TPQPSHVIPTISTQTTHFDTPHTTPNPPPHNHKTLNPHPTPPNPNPQPPNPKPQTPNPKPQNPKPKPQNPNPKPQTPNPKTPTPKPQAQKHNTQPATQKPIPRKNGNPYTENATSSPDTTSRAHATRLLTR